MNKYISRAVKSTVLIVLLTMSSCNDFFDINKDPNNPLDSRLGLVLPTVETVIFEALGSGSGGLSDLTSQFVHHTVQRGPSNFYFVQGTEFAISNPWNNLYSGALKDLDIMIEKATATESYQFLGVAQILKAYTYSMMVDVWGKAAFTEFGQGSANPFAKFDDGDLVYAESIKLLNEALANLDKTSVETIGASEDLVYGGDSDKWINLAGSLKLKLYNNVRLTGMYNAEDVAATIASGKLLSDVDEGFKLLYVNSNNPENRHPLFKKTYVDANANYIDPYFFLIMNGNGTFNPLLTNITDPRIPFYFYNQLAGDTPQNPATSAKFGDFLSIWFASFNIDPNEGFDQSQSQTVEGVYPAGGAYDDGEGVTAGVADKQNPGAGGVGYQRLYAYFSHLYTRAELSLTKGAPGDHRTLFEQAIRASMNEVNEAASAGGIGEEVSEDDIESYVASVLALYDAASDQGKLELIITEKWIASFGFSVDAYTDYRRTGFPPLFDPNADNNPFTILSRSFPVSFPYYTSDLQINPNAPSLRNPSTDKVFWDAN